MRLIVQQEVELRGRRMRGKQVLPYFDRTEYDVMTGVCEQLDTLGKGAVVSDASDNPVVCWAVAAA